VFALEGNMYRLLCIALITLISLSVLAPLATINELERTDAGSDPTSMISRSSEFMLGAVQGGFEYTAIGGKYIIITKYIGSQRDVTIPSEIGGIPVRFIGENAFEYSFLTSVIIPDSVTRIGDYAFYYCSFLKSIDIPEGVTYIGEYAFMGCASLTHITIPEGVTRIGTFAFFACNSLTSVTIPASVTSIGRGAFDYCFKMKTLQFKGNSPDHFMGWSYLDQRTKVYYVDGAYGFDSPSWSGVETIALTRPEAPIGLEEIAGVGEVTLRWNAPPNLGEPMEYEVWYAAGEGDSVWMLFETVDGLTSTITGLDEGTTYRFGVKAVNIAGTSSLSTTYLMSPSTSEAPTVSATAGDGQVELSWNVPSGSGSAVMEYVIYLDGAELARTSETTYLVTGLTNGKEYRFQVAARNVAGIGDKSESVSVIPLPAMVPIRGNMVDAAGNGIAGIKVSLEDGTSVMTGEGGGFVIMAGQGSHTLTFSAGDIEYAEENVTVDGMQLDLGPIPVMSIDGDIPDDAALLVASAGIVLTAAIVVTFMLRRGR